MASRQKCCERINAASDYRGDVRDLPIDGSPASRGKFRLARALSRLLSDKYFTLAFPPCSHGTSESHYALSASTFPLSRVRPSTRPPAIYASLRRVLSMRA